ncbi:uncharacterized protein LOC114269344 isoform X3 [Camellia sinensis]|uniref:uncharacterized protein LOC114269344 isoform X3 n=1 Tax=Camellia sinensis TaxID=4442 RepID=UPI001036BEA2|nr:uncharacterized protein LOC114269344 isoform X3 [Camellia sinensis]
MYVCLLKLLFKKMPLFLYLSQMRCLLLEKQWDFLLLGPKILYWSVMSALKIYETTQRRRRTIPVWKVVQSPQQPTNVECGFYVMRYMKDLIRDQSILRKQNFNGKKTYTETELDEVRVEWINFILKNMS